MAGTIRENKTVLTAEDRTGGAFASMQKNIAGVEQQAMKMQAMFAGLAGGAIVGGFAAMIKGAVDAMAAMKDSAQEAGLMVTQLQRFEAPARLAGVSLGEVSGAMQKLSRALVEAKDPVSNAALALKTFGINANDLKGLSLDEQFEKIARASEKYAGSAEKNAALMELTGKSGATLQKLFAEMAAAGSLQASVTNEQAEAADELSDTWERVKMQQEAVARGTASALIPSLTAALKAFEDLNSTNTAWTNTMELAGGVIRLFTGLVGSAWLALTDMGDALGAWMAKVAAFARGDLDGIQAINKARDEQYAKNEAAYEKLWANMRTTKKLAEEMPDNWDLQGSKKTAGYDPTAAAAKRKADADAMIAQKKALADMLKREQTAWNDAAAAAAEYEKLMGALLKEGDALVKSSADQLQKMREEEMLLGLTGVAREQMIIQLETEAAVRTGKLDPAQRKSLENLQEERKKMALVIDQRKLELQAQADQVGMYDQLATSAGNFFGDLVVNGKSAFDNLKQSLKSFAADLIALFAKRWILNLVGNMIGGNTGSMLLQMGSTAGNGSMAGTLLNAGGSSMMAIGGSAILGGAGGYFGAKAMGAGERGQKVGGITGATGAAIGMMIAGPIGAAIGALAGALIGKFTDPDGLAQRSAMFGGRSSGTIPRSATSAFGTFGVYDDKWFGDDMNDKIKTFLTGLAELDDGFAKFLTTTEIDRVKAALKDAKSYGFGEEHSDFSGTLGQILNDRITAVFNAIDPSLTKWLDGFKGTGEELAAYAQAILQVRQALASSEVESLLGRIPELTIEGLSKIQEAGESLSDTFLRVVGEFLTAQNNLNAAIGSRNPQFARDLVLSQRNGLAAQFATLVGRDFGDALLAQMALQPETFTNLNTAGMNLLANFLGLQTSLEQLDSQLAGSGTSAVVNFTNALVNSTSAITDARANLASYLQGSLLSDASPLSPMARYAEARRQYNENLALAQNDNVDAISNFGQYRDAFLAASRLVNASNGQYNTDFFGTYNQGANLPNSGVRPYTAADADRLAERSLAAMAVQSEKTQQVTQAVVALAAAVIDNASQNTAQTKAVLDDQLLALNKIANTGGALASTGALP